MTGVIDLDDVLVPFIIPLHRWSNRARGMNFSEEYIRTTTDYRLQNWNLSRQELSQCIVDFYDSKERWNGELIAGARWGVRKLRALDRLVIITSVDVVRQQHAEDLVQFLFPDVFNDVICMGRWYSGGEEETKAVIAKRLGAKYAIDDSPTNTQRYNEAGIPAILFPQAWNENTNLPNPRLNWQRIPNYVRETIYHQSRKNAKPTILGPDGKAVNFD